MGNERHTLERLIYVPIERLEERYSAQWDDWFRQAFDEQNISYIPVGDSTERKINHGEFLDVVETNIYKTKQLQQILDIISSDPAQYTTVFFMDLWFPGIEQLFYIRDGMKLPIKIKGMLHAGSYDPYDFLSRAGMTEWARHFEAMICQEVDEVFLATQFHKDLIWKANLNLSSKKITYVEWPVETNFKLLPKENIVVFPHRLAPEKQPWEFEQLEAMFNQKYGIRAFWIKTKDVCNSKDEYYELLARSKVAVSTATQETFGIAMVEAVNNGCIPVAPNRLSYPEVLNQFKQYNSLEEAVDMIYDALTNYKRPNKIEGKTIPWVSKIIR